MKIYILFLLFLLSASEYLYSQRYPFHGGSGFAFENPVQGESAVTIYLKVRSTSNSMNYPRILSGDTYFLELADHNGLLSIYNGKAWHDTNLDIRSEFVDLFLLFDRGSITVFANGKELAQHQHANSEIYDSYKLFFGANYKMTEQITGFLDAFGIFGGLLSSSERLDVAQKHKALLKHPNVKLAYHYGSKEYVDLKKSKKLMKIPPIIMDTPPPPESNRVPDQMEKVVETIPEMHFYLPFNDPYNESYRGHFKRNSPMKLPQGLYELEVLPNGKVVLKKKQ